MAYDKGLAQRLRELLADRPVLTEREMFGGIGFMLRGNMSVGVLGDELIVRVGPEAYDTALDRPHARVFDFSGRPMKGWVMVGADGFESDDALSEWVDRGARFALSLPAK